MLCPHCQYDWIERRNKPRFCPRCKQYIKYEKFVVGEKKEEAIKELEKPIEEEIKEPTEEEVEKSLEEVKERDLFY